MKHKIQEIESRIIELVGSDLEQFNYDELSKEQKEEVKHLLSERRRILNEMFQPTKANIAQFRKINNELYRLTLVLNERVMKFIYKKELLLDTPDFDDDYELEGTLKFMFNDETSICQLPDDEYYGSNFALMIKTLYEVYSHSGIESIVTINEHHGPLDDGVSWYEYPFNRVPEFKDFIICYAVHDLTDHKLYSIPDPLRLNDFWSKVNFKVQSITNGTAISNRLHNHKHILPENKAIKNRRSMGAAVRFWQSRSLILPYSIHLRKLLWQKKQN